ncbi:MAG: hypothetical protein LBT25_03000 [Candidatus Symbiothrix sp.]|jgi:hypothetical protein|nr:hypothetical protein [Candidatus Symbiothrix sp.]
MMRILIYVFLGIFSINTLQTSAQVRIGGSENAHSSAVLDLNETDTKNDGNRGLALPRVMLSSDTDPLNGTTPPNGMMVYNTSAVLDKGVYYYAENKWIKLPDGSSFSGDTIVGNEVVGPTPNGALKRDGSGTTLDPYTLDIDKKGVKSDLIAKEAVTGEKIANAPADKSVLVSDGNQWATAQAANILKGATAAGLKIKYIDFTSGNYSNGTKFIDYKKQATDPEKTIYLVNGSYYDNAPGSAGYAPIYILGRTATTVTLSNSTGTKTAKYSVMRIEFE